MTSPSERLAAAKAAPRPTLDVEVLLDNDLAARRSEVQDRLAALLEDAASDPRLAAENPAIGEARDELAAIQLESAGAIATLRFTALPGGMWSEITDRCPARLDAPMDTLYGYNMHKATRLAAPRSGVWVVDGQEIPLRVQKASEGSPAVDEWADLFATVQGPGAAAIYEAIYQLNVFDPQTRAYELKKELATLPA